MNRTDIIVITYNAKEALGACLDSIRRCTRPDSYTLTVVDNRSTDGTPDYLKSLKGLDVITTTANRGFSYAANIALRKTTGRYVALLDDDVAVSRGWLETLLSCAKHKKNVGIVGPKTVTPDGRIFSADSLIRRMSGLADGEIDRGQRDYVKECDAIPGPCWLVRRSVVRDAGYFDEKFFPCHHEDLDYCLRARLAGYRIVYCGAATVVHRGLNRSMGNEGRNARYFERKWRKTLPRLPLKDSPRDAKLAEEGLSSFERGDFAAALRSFRRADTIRPGYIGPYYIARSLYETGRYAESMRAFQAALAAYHHDCDFYGASMHFLYRIYMKLGLGQQVLDTAICLQKQRDRRDKRWASRAQ